MLATGDYDDVGLRRTHVGWTDRVSEHARAHAAIDDVTLTVRRDPRIGTGGRQTRGARRCAVGVGGRCDGRRAPHRRRREPGRAVR